MLNYILTTSCDEHNKPLFKSVTIANRDKRRFVRWQRDHQKGREFVNQSFRDMRFAWGTDGTSNLSIADFPFTSDSGSLFSQKAVFVLRSFLLANGDLHPIIMPDDYPYYLFDCWPQLQPITTRLFNDKGLPSQPFLNDIYMSNDSLIVSEKFKEIACNANLTGMLFTELSQTNSKPPLKTIPCSLPTSTSLSPHF